MSYQRYLSVILISFGIIYGGSALVYLINPTLFYFRAWEYFEEVVYHYNVQPVWRGNENPDLARDYLLHYQNSTPTLVTTDNHGFRSVPFPSAQYQVIVHGQSFVFGSGLSDDETLPWILAEEIGVPVFNASRTKLVNSLKQKKLQGIGIVIQLKPERLLRNGVFKDEVQQANHLFIPIAEKSKKPFFLSVFELSGQRYLVPSIIKLSLKRLFLDFKMMAYDLIPDDHLFIRHKFKENDLEQAAKAILKQQQMVMAMGKRYVFAAIPSKQWLYAEKLAYSEKIFLSALHSRLLELGVESIPLYKDFKKNKSMGLYQAYDTHWNKAGARVAATTIADYLKNN